MDYLIGTILVIGGWVTKTIFDTFLKVKIERAAKTIFSEIYPTKTQDKYSGLVKIGNIQTDLYLIDGDGESEYSQNSIEAFYHDGAPDSPDDIADRIALQDQAMETAREEGNADIFDGIGVGIRSLSRLRSNDEKHLGLNIKFYKTRYAAFRATITEIGKEDRSNPDSIYNKYIKDSSPDQPVDFLARHVGISAIIVTKDDLIIAAYRANDTGVRKNEFDVSVVEGIDPIKDGDFSGSKAKIDIYKSIQRGCREELGFTPKSSQIKILGFGVDMNFYQYNFLAYIKSDLTFKQISEIKAGKAKDRWETTIKPIPYRIADTLELMNSNRMWGFAYVLFYWSLLQEFSPTAVEAQAAQRLAAKPSYRERR